MCWPRNHGWYIHTESGLAAIDTNTLYVFTWPNYEAFKLFTSPMIFECITFLFVKELLVTWPLIPCITFPNLASDCTKLNPCQAIPFLKHVILLFFHKQFQSDGEIYFLKFMIPSNLSHVMLVQLLSYEQFLKFQLRWNWFAIECEFWATNWKWKELLSLVPFTDEWNQHEMALP